MECKAKDPAGHLMLFPPIFKFGKLGEGNMLITGQFIILPLEGLPLRQFVGWVEYAMDYDETVIRWETLKVSLRWENPGVPPPYIFKNT